MTPHEFRRNGHAVLLSSGLGVQGMLWATSPACTELETLVLDWLVAMLGLPERFKSTTAGGGVIADRMVLRLAVGGTYTARRHVEQAWALLRQTAHRVAAVAAR
jgi:pyridoxal-dependent decarboxylase-like protein